MDQAARGKKALANSNYEEAITEFSAALKTSPTSPDYLIQRSTAYQRAKKYSEALADANNAVLNAQKRAKRELIVEGQFRRGCALYSLGRYGDAEFVFGVVKRMNEKHKMVATWLSKTSMALKNLEEGDEKGKCTVKETPDVEEEAAATNGSGKAADTTPSTAPPASTPAPPQQTPANKVRYDWYQNNDNIYFTLLAKGVPKDKAQIEIQDRCLSISFPLSSGSSYNLTLEPLFGPVKADKCTSKIMSTKVEITLVKATSGQKWNALESNEPVPKPAAPGDAEATNKNDSDAVKQAVLTSSSTNSKPTGPAYPTSSKSGPKDWDKIVSEERKADGEGKPGSPEDDDDYEGGDEANHFFKKLFKGASPEVQRAMMKSYTESNGTALSTNWDEVGKAKVETLPPDGMEARKW